MLARWKKSNIEFNTMLAMGDISQLRHIEQMPIFAYLALVDKFTAELELKLKPKPKK